MLKKFNTPCEYPDCRDFIHERHDSDFQHDTCGHDDLLVDLCERLSSFQLSVTLVIERGLLVTKI